MMITLQQRTDYKMGKGGGEWNEPNVTSKLFGTTRATPSLPASNTIYINPTTVHEQQQQPPFLISFNSLSDLNFHHIDHHRAWNTSKKQSEELIKLCGQTEITDLNKLWRRNFLVPVEGGSRGYLTMTR